MVDEYNAFVRLAVVIKSDANDYIIVAVPIDVTCARDRSAEEVLRSGPLLAPVKILREACR